MWLSSSSRTNQSQRFGFYIVNGTKPCRHLPDCRRTLEIELLHTQVDLCNPEFIKEDEWPPQCPDCPNGLRHVGLSELESLPGIERQIDKTGVKET